MYKAVFNKDREALYRINNYARVKSSGNVETTLQTRIRNQREKCEKKKSKAKTDCFQEIKAVEEQLEFMRKLDKERRQDSKFALYRNFVIISYTVRYEILEESYRDWERSCFRQDRINTLKCNKSFLKSMSFFQF